MNADISYIGCMSDHTSVCVCLRQKKLYLQVIGTLDSVSELGGIIAWLGAALRSSPEKRGVVYCSPILSNLSIQKYEVDKTTVTSQIDFRFEVDKNGSLFEGTNGRCWHGLFRNPVSVKGYPIRVKPQEDMGIEIPIEIMAGLAGSNLISTYAKNIFIKSFCTMLILSKQVGDILVWHLLFNEDGEHISYADSRVCASNTQNLMGMITAELHATYLGGVRKLRTWLVSTINY